MRFEQGEYIDIAGKRYGKLTVIDFSHFELKEEIENANNTQTN